MKKYIAISAFAVLGVVALSSCKKDWTCSCTINGTTGSAATYKDTKKSDAKASCDALQSLAIIGDPSASCSIN